MDDRADGWMIAMWALAAGLAGCAAMWASGWMATTATGGSFDVPFGRSLSGTFNLLRTPSDPAGAWGDPDVPGTALYWTISGISLFVLGGVVLGLGKAIPASFGFESRTRLGAEGEARMATAKDLKPLFVKRLPVTGRFVLGVLGRQVLATEYPENPQNRLHRWERRRRQGGRSAVALCGITQAGKSVMILTAMFEWPGPIVNVSAKSDLIDPTLAHRRRQGEVGIFDPIGELTQGFSTPGGKSCKAWDPRLVVGWSPLRDVATFDRAQAAAKALRDSAPSGGVEKADFFMDSAVQVVSVLLWVAGNSGRNMGDVLRWVQTTDRPTDNSSGEVQPLLDRLKLSPTPDVQLSAESAQNAFTAAIGDDPKTRASIYTTARNIVWPWATRTVADSSKPPPVTLEWLLSGNNTLYMTAPPDDIKRLSPVFGGFLLDLMNQAFRYVNVHGPIDPPLLIVIDEAGNIPIKELPTYASTVAGLGIQLVTAWQSLAQMHSTYKDDADTLLANHATKVFFPGASDTKTLEYVSKVSGEEEVSLRSRSDDRWAILKGSSTASEHRTWLLPLNTIRQMRRGTALLFHGTLPPAHIQTIKWFRKLRYRRLQAWNQRHADMGIPFISAANTTNTTQATVDLVDIASARHTHHPAVAATTSGYRGDGVDNTLGEATEFIPPNGAPTKEQFETVLVGDSWPDPVALTRHHNNLHDHAVHDSPDPNPDDPAPILEGKSL